MPDRADPNDALAALAADYWDLTMRTNPSWATLLGDHRFDDQIEDFTEDGSAAERAALTGIAARLGGIDRASLGTVDLVTAELLASDVSDRIRTIDLRIVELSSNQMDGPHVQYLISTPEIAPETPDQARMLVVRFGRLGSALDGAVERWRAGVAAGRTPARLCIERSLSSVDGYLGSSLDDDLFVNVAAPPGWDGEAAWREELRRVVRESVRPAYQRVRDALAEELRPVARPDDRAGVCWLDGGEELYAELIRLHTSLPIPAQELHDIGVEAVERTLPEEYATIGARALGVDDPAEIYRRVREDRELRFASKDEIVQLAEATVSRAEAAMGPWFGRLPRATCRVEPVPAFLAEDAPGAYYFPPAADGSRPGTYYVNRRNATDQSRVEAESIAFHEAIPGHHLQLAIASELEDLPAFRRLGSGSTAYIEGWALYAERLADEMGLYSDDVARLGMLAGDSWRAGRLVVDTGLHALGWSRQQARDYLWENSPVGADELEAEIDRYVAIPGQAVSYKTGQREIMALRAGAEERLGERFDIAGFHDTVLGSGGVTLPVLRDLVEDWIERTATA